MSMMCEQYCQMCRWSCSSAAKCVDGVRAMLSYVSMKFDPFCHMCRWSVSSVAKSVDVV